MTSWFDVDKEGLAKILEKRGKAFAIFELIQNAWDTNAKNVSVRLVPVPVHPKAILEVEDDDPNGFANISHAFTLFAESEKIGCCARKGKGTRSAD